MMFSDRNNRKLAFRVTLHCVVGCGLGDTAGLVIGTMLGLSLLPTMILAVVLGFVGGYTLTILPLLQRGVNLKEATKITLVSETASIFVMELAENATAFLIPGVLVASFFSTLFWVGLFVAVIAGFLAAYPVNYYMLLKGLKEGHLHH